MNASDIITGKRTRELYHPELGVRIREIDDNKVRPNVLGLVEFDKGRITVPTFRNIINTVKNYVRQKYIEAAEGLKNYILMHEIKEYYEKPGKPEEHARMEADLLYRTWDPFGIITHYIGLGRRRFTQQVNEYFPVERAYKSLERVYGRPGLEEMTDTVRKLLGKERLEPHETYNTDLGPVPAAAGYGPRGGR